jgi:hypothetical protein
MRASVPGLIFDPTSVYYTKHKPRWFRGFSNAGANDPTDENRPSNLSVGFLWRMRVD